MQLRQVKVVEGIYYPRSDWIPEEEAEFLHENFQHVISLLDCVFLPPSEEFLVFMLDYSVKRNSKKFGN